MTDTLSPIMRASAVLTCLVALNACSHSSTPRTDQHFGQSLRALQAAQTLCPTPAQHRPAELAGDVAVLVQQNYRRSFDERSRVAGGVTSLREQLK